LWLAILHHSRAGVPFHCDFPHWAGRPAVEARSPRMQSLSIRPRPFATRRGASGPGAPRFLSLPLSCCPGRRCRRLRRLDRLTTRSESSASV